MLEKIEVIEMMFRPQPMPEAILKSVKEELMKLSASELAATFRKSTNLTLVPVSGKYFTIKY